MCFLTRIKTKIVVWYNTTFRMDEIKSKIGECMKIQFDVQIIDNSLNEEVSAPNKFFIYVEGEPTENEFNREMLFCGLGKDMSQAWRVFRDRKYEYFFDVFSKNLKTDIVRYKKLDKRNIERNK